MRVIETNVGQSPHDQRKGEEGSDSLKDDQSRNLKMGCLSRDVRRAERAEPGCLREQNWLRQSEGEGCQLSLRLKRGTSWEVAKLNKYKPMDGFTSVNHTINPDPRGGCCHRLARHRDLSHPRGKDKLDAAD